MQADLDYLRPRMMSVAYRMLGTVADAEDAVQDAYLRLQTADEVASPEGFLIKVTTRRCIDHLRVRNRTEYIGPWVPEPIDTPARDSAIADSLSQAFLLLLERLTPDERAALLLRTVFDYEYAEIAEVVDKPEATVRQLVSRARRRLGLEERRFRGDPHRAGELAEQFLAACRLGDVKAVEDLLAQDIEVHSDGGGKITAARVVLREPARVARFLAGIFRKHSSSEIRHTMVNGEPGLVFTSDGNVIQVMSIAIENGIRGIYITRNPDKLTRWSTVEVD